MSNTSQVSQSSGTIWAQFLTLIIVFFFWGFVAASNDILIPVFKENLHLTQTQSQLVAFAFYIAYTVGSLIYYSISKSRGEDILNKIGYKNGIALGLIISALGTLIFSFIYCWSVHCWTGIFSATNCCQPACYHYGRPKVGFTEAQYGRRCK